MMFYNGFNLLIDIILAGIVWALTYRAAWWRGYSEGYQDGNKNLEREMIEAQVRDM